MLHIQWTGSNTHNNGDPGGDGQTGDAGQGTEGTDRHNFVQYFNPGLFFFIFNEVSSMAPSKLNR